MNHCKPLLLLSALFCLIAIQSCREKPDPPLSIQEQLDAGESPQSLYIDLSLSPSELIGKEYLGGVILFINRFEDGSSILPDIEYFGIISAKEALGTFPWGCEGTIMGTIYPDTIYDGSVNTATILMNCDQMDIAARIASEYSIDGYSDWHLPSFGQLEESSNALVDLGFPVGSYWSSSEWDLDRAWATQPYTNDVLEARPKSESNFVLPMKPF